MVAVRPSSVDAPYSRGLELSKRGRLVAAHGFVPSDTFFVFSGFGRQTKVSLSRNGMTSRWAFRKVGPASSQPFSATVVTEKIEGKGNQKWKTAENKSKM